MAKQIVLVTGGAGFIGSFLVDRLIEEGYSVRIFDNLEPQVHHNKIPPYINKKAIFIKSDIRDYNALKKAMKGVSIIFHLASRVGVGQANYQIKDYIDVNISGLANILDILVNTKHKVKKILMTASMSSYGEGDYICKTHGVVKPYLRSDENMLKKKWEPTCNFCKKVIKAIGTSEQSEMSNKSIYALSKNVQEQMLHFFGKTYKVPTVALRCFNVYGPRQSLSNPYTGVSAIIISRLKNGKNPLIYEDGQQTRDFVSVHDVVEALILSMKNKKADYHSFNIGSGTPTTIKAMAELLAKLLDVNIKPKILLMGRKGDIRHCYANIEKAKSIINWKPKINLEDGLEELIEWSSEEKSIDLSDKALKELQAKKLFYEKN